MIDLDELKKMTLIKKLDEYTMDYMKKFVKKEIIKLNNTNIAPAYFDASIIFFAIMAIKKNHISLKKMQGNGNDYYEYDYIKENLITMREVINFELSDIIGGKFNENNDEDNSDIGDVNNLLFMPGSTDKTK
jgi:hypothetical protein